MWLLLVRREDRGQRAARVTGEVIATRDGIKLPSPEKEASWLFPYSKQVPKKRCACCRGGGSGGDEKDTHGCGSCIDSVCHSDVIFLSFLSLPLPGNCDKHYCLPRVRYSSIQGIRIDLEKDVCR